MDVIMQGTVYWFSAGSVVLTADPVGTGDHHRIHLHRRSLTNPDQVIRWASKALPADEAGKLLRRLASESRPRLPEPGEHGSEIATGATAAGPTGGLTKVYTANVSAGAWLVGI